MQRLGPGDPQRIGTYRLLARLGAGGMGEVFLARSERGRTVAVKLVREELAAQEEFRDRFRQEVQAARRVGGHWTAPVLDADTEAAVPWVATGYVAGPSLQQVVGHDHGALPERSVRILGAGLAHALKDIHAAGIVHRDLKPSNVLVTIDGPRVIDFGIARALETVTESGGLTRTGSLVGSPGFMAPEQVRGDRVTPACDVFCLGSVLAYAATGKLPFGSADSGVHALMYRIAQEEPDLEGVPEGLADLVRACLRKNPEARPGLDHVLELTGAHDTLAEGRSRDPWLPSALVAQLGRHAVQLLETENPEGPEPTSSGTAAGPGGAPGGPAGPGAGAGSGAGTGPEVAAGAQAAAGAGAAPAGHTAATPGAAPGPAVPAQGGYAAPAPQPASTPAAQATPSPQAAPAPAPAPQGYAASGPYVPGAVAPSGPQGAPPPPGVPGQVPTAVTGPAGPGQTGPAVPPHPVHSQPTGPVQPAAHQHPQQHQPAYGYPHPGGGWPGQGGAAPAPQPYHPRSTPPYGAPPVGAGAYPPGDHGTPPRRNGRTTVLLVLIALVVAVAAGGTVYALLNGGGDDEARPAPTTSQPAPTGAGDPSREPEPSPSLSDGSASPRATGAVPDAYLGTWTATIDNASGVNTRRLTIEQGEVGDTVLTLVADGPTDAGTYHCVFEANLTARPSASGPLQIGPSRVVSGAPRSSCSPGAATRVTLLPDGTLERVSTGTGEKLTYRKEG
ncbi:protein kinase [Streptomyces sp. NPDC057386]|uniref:serine/threonine-protein kinase n=1 Tax=unclassified Streptomyces TaxID=2593676 RepID=UPI00363357ED